MVRAAALPCPTLSAAAAAAAHSHYNSSTQIKTTWSKLENCCVDTGLDCEHLPARSVALTEMGVAPDALFASRRSRPPCRGLEQMMKSYSETRYESHQTFHHALAERYLTDDCTNSRQIVFLWPSQAPKRAISCRFLPT